MCDFWFCISDTDRDFDPPVEMLVNDDDDDDEQTLEEEENMSDNSYSNELSELEKVTLVFNFC